MLSVDITSNVTTAPVVGEVPVVGGTMLDDVKSLVEKKVNDETSQEWSSKNEIRSVPVKSHSLDKATSKNSHRKNSWKGEKKTTSVQTESRVSIYDVTRNWIDSENSPKLWKAKKLLFKFATGELRNRDFMFYAPIYKFVDYLSEGSRGYFSMVADHVDYDNEKIARLYDWRVRDRDEGNYHVYIVAIGDAPSSTFDLVSKKMEVYESVAEKNWDQEKNAITPKGYSIVRRFATTDFCTSFMKLNFFTEFNLAKAFITSSVSGYVHFIKKSRDTKEQDSWEAQQDSWNVEE